MKGTNKGYRKFQCWTALKTILTYFSIVHTARMTRLSTEIIIYRRKYIFNDSINKTIPAQLSTKILKIMTPNP